MRFEETERYAEIIHKYECMFGRTPKSLVYTEYAKSVKISANVTYLVSLHDEAYILSSSCTSGLSGLNVCFGQNAFFSSYRNLNGEGFASYFSIFHSSSLPVAMFVSYYKPVW